MILVLVYFLSFVVLLCYRSVALVVMRLLLIRFCEFVYCQKIISIFMVAVFETSLVSWPRLGLIIIFNTRTFSRWLYLDYLRQIAVSIWYAVVFCIMYCQWNFINNCRGFFIVIFIRSSLTDWCFYIRSNMEFPNNCLCEHYHWCQFHTIHYAFVSTTVVWKFMMISLKFMQGLEKDYIKWIQLLSSYYLVKVPLKTGGGVNIMS